MKHRYRRAEGGAWMGIVINAALGSAQLAGGVMGASTALAADGVHSLSDAASSIVVLLGLRAARKPADSNHPYGHGKAEFLAAQAVAVMLILVGLGIGYRSARMILSPVETALPEVYTLWFVIACIFIKEGMFQYKIRLGRRLNSESMITDAWHHRSDAFSSLCALVGIAAALSLGPQWRVLDPAAALIICVILVGAGAGSLVRTGRALMDEAADEDTQRDIRRVAHGVEGVLGTEKLITRRSGLETHVELHLEVDAKTPVGQAHDIASAVRRAVCAALPGVTRVVVHVEPHGQRPVGET